MNCPSCGAENRQQARFCNRCGASLEKEPGPQSYEPQSFTPQPEPDPYQQSFNAPAAGPDTTDTVQKVSIFGGNGFITFGALVVLLGFMLPWASCSGMQQANLSGLDIAIQSGQYTGDASGTFLLLVPLGALMLLALGAAGIGLNLSSKSLPANLVRLVPFLPLTAVLPGLCGCCPSSIFFYQIQSARTDPESYGMGMLIQVEHGFWITMVGLGMAFIGIVAASVGGLMARRETEGWG